MDDKHKKQSVLKQLQPEVYLIYGIFDFKRKKLVYVSLDAEEVDLKFDVEDYNEAEFDTITVKIMVN